MTAGDGNGWVWCPLGHRHWGRHGAAGLLLVRRSASSAPRQAPQSGMHVLMQLRAPWTDAGGTWGVPGGAADSHESAPQAALREAHEEAGLDPSALRVLREVVTTDHGDWRYTTVVATPSGPVHPVPANEESDEITWVSLADIDSLRLHSAFAESWPMLRTLIDDLSELVAAGEEDDELDPATPVTTSWPRDL